MIKSGFDYNFRLNPEKFRRRRSGKDCSNSIGSPCSLHSNSHRNCHVHSLRILNKHALVSHQRFQTIKLCWLPITILSTAAPPDRRSTHQISPCEWQPAIAQLGPTYYQLHLPPKSLIWGPRFGQFGDPVSGLIGVPHIDLRRKGPHFA